MLRVVPKQCKGEWQRTEGSLACDSNTTTACSDTTAGSGFFERFGTLATVGYKTPTVLFFWLHNWRQCPPALLFWLQRPKCCQTLILMCYDYWGSRGSQEGSNGAPSRAPGYNRLLSSLGLAGFEPTSKHSNSTPSTPKGTCPQVTITNRHWEKINSMPRKTATRQFFAAGLLATQGSPVFKFG